MEAIARKGIVFEHGKDFSTDATTKYARVTDKSEEPVEPTELKAGVRVRYELSAGKLAVKVVILPAKNGGE